MSALTLQQFDTLDVAVQEEFERFLQERGINESLAMFIPEYAEYKEQKVRSALAIARSDSYCMSMTTGVRQLAPAHEVICRGLGAGRG